MIVNVEAQKTYSPGYEVVTRGIFYASRLISAQLGVEFEHSDYDSIKKVFSIWICMNAPTSVGNAISSYAFAKSNLLGSLPDKPSAYDKAEVVIIALNATKSSGNDLVDMLNLVLSPVVSKEEKIRDLEGRYNVPVKGDVAKGVNVMCNLSDYVEEYATKRGMERGMEQGMQQGMQQGRDDKLTELVIQNLKSGRKPEEFASYLGLTADEVREIEQGALAPA